MHPSLKLAALAAAATVSMATAAADPEWMKSVGEALGKSGAPMPGGIYRVGLARTDLKVTLDGVEIKPALALGSHSTRWEIRALSWVTSCFSRAR